MTKMEDKLEEMLDKITSKCDSCIHIKKCPIQSNKDFSKVKTGVTACSCYKEVK